MTLLERLRTETRTAHDRIERAVDFAGCASTRAGYRSLLARYYGFHRAWEPAAAPLIGDAAFFAPRCKTGLLAKDLQALGLDREAIAALPACAPLMPLPTPAAAFGAMYVVEGSTLGGAVIARHIRRTLGLTAETGCAYFSSYGKAIGPMWASFCARLLSTADPDTEDTAVEAALNTFGVMQAWLGSGAPQ